MKLLVLLLLVGCASATKNRMSFVLPAGESKFCFVGDMGMGDEVQEKVARALEKENCRSLHFVGDLVYPNGIDSIDDPLLEEHFLKFYRNIKAPISLILGNHDHRKNEDAWPMLPKRDPKYVMPDFYYLQNWSGLCLVHLDTNYYKLLKDLFKGLAQSNWLGQQQEYMKDNCTVKVALTHHPYKSRGPHHFNARGSMKDFLENHIRGKFDYLISGHEHILSDEGEQEGTRLLITGAGGNRTKGEAFGYLVMHVETRDGRVIKSSYSFKKVDTF